MIERKYLFKPLSYFEKYNESIFVVREPFFGTFLGNRQVFNPRGGATSEADVQKSVLNKLKKREEWKIDHVIIVLVRVCRANITPSPRFQRTEIKLIDRCSNENFSLSLPLSFQIFLSLFKVY